MNNLFPGSYSLSILIVAFAIVLTLLILLLLFSFVFLLMWLAASRSHAVLGKRGVNVLAISEQGVQNRNALSNGISSWQAFKAIEEDKRNIYLVMDQPGRIFMTHMIPKRFFESPTQAARFVERARGYWQQQAMQVVINRS